MKSENQNLVESLWNLFSQQKWEESKQLLHEEFTAEWPQSRERFNNPKDFIEMNAAYPVNHTIEILDVVASGAKVVSSVYVYADTGQKAFATTFFQIRDGKIWKLVEFWAEPYEQPEWRKKFSARY